MAKTCLVFSSDGADRQRRAGRQGGVEKLPALPVDHDDVGARQPVAECRLGEFAERLDGAAAQAAGLGQHLQGADVGLELAPDLLGDVAGELERAVAGDRLVVGILERTGRQGPSASNGRW